MNRKFLLFFYICLLLLPHSSNQQNAHADDLQDYWPTLDWRTSTPEDQGMNSKELVKMDEYLYDMNWDFLIDSLIIIRNGYIVYEDYAIDSYVNTTHHIFSCTKVITSTLVGICVDEGNITSLRNNVVDYFPHYSFEGLDTTKQSITVQHLLTMTSGLDWYDNTDYYLMASSPNPIEYVLNKSMVATPGTQWNYNTGCSHILSNIVQNVSEIGTANLAANRLFSPLGIDEYTWNNILGVPNGGTQLFLKSRDMGKIGLLHLNKGKWNDTIIVSEAWVDEATQSFISVDNPAYGSSYPGYGYQWWIFKEENSFGARGSNSQNILILPHLNMIVVSTARGEFSLEYLVDHFIIPSTNQLNLTGILIGAGGVLAISAGVGVFVIYKRKRS